MVHYSEMAEFLAIACLPNDAAGANKHTLTHQEVSETAKKSSETFSKLRKKIISKIGKKL